MISAESDVRRHCFFSFQPALSETAHKACSLAHMTHSCLHRMLHLQPLAPAKNADWMNAHYARLRSSYAAQDKPSTLDFTNPDQKGA